MRFHGEEFANIRQRKPGGTYLPTPLAPYPILQNCHCAAVLTLDHDASGKAVDRSILTDGGDRHVI